MVACRWPLGNGYYLSFSIQNAICLEVDATMTYVMLRWQNWEQFREFVNLCMQFHNAHQGMEPPDIRQVDMPTEIPNVFKQAFEAT